jgi:hypothetical protein
MELQWAMANYGRRFPLLPAADACRSIFGVYLLYHDGNPDRPILIGSGDIRHHLQALANDPGVAAFSVAGMLRATWAAVPGRYVEGVENYLIEQLDPMISQHPLRSAIRITVNLPTERASPAAASLPCRPSLKRRKLRGFASVLLSFLESCGFTFRGLVRQTRKSASPPRHHQACRGSNRPPSMSLFDRGRDSRPRRLEWAENAMRTRQASQSALSAPRRGTRHLGR